MSNYEIDEFGNYRSAFDYDVRNVDELQDLADKLLSQKRSGDGWHYYDETIGVTRGIILSFSDYASDNSEQALNETNLAFAKDHMAANGEEGVDFDFGYISGFGGTHALTVKVYEDPCTTPDGLIGEHAWIWSDDEHGYEDVPGFEDEPIYRCTDCGAEYVGAEYDGPKVYTRAFLAAADMAQALEDYPILDESAWSDREWELNDEDMTREIEGWASEQDDLTDEQAEQVVDVFRNLDYLPEGIDPNGWDHMMVTEFVTPDSYVDAEALVKVLDWCKDAWYTERGNEQLTAQIDGQIAMEVL